MIRTVEAVRIGRAISNVESTTHAACEDVSPHALAEDSCVRRVLFCLLEPIDRSDGDTAFVGELEETGETGAFDESDDGIRVIIVDAHPRVGGSDCLASQIVSERNAQGLWVGGLGHRCLLVEGTWRDVSRKYLKLQSIMLFRVTTKLLFIYHPSDPLLN